MMKIIIIDDDSSVRFALSELLTIEGFNVIQASNGEEALSKLENESIDIAILDYHLPGINGLDLLKIIKENFKWMQVIFITAYGSENVAISAIKNGAYDYVTKPFNNYELLNRINHIKESLSKTSMDQDYQYGYYFSQGMKEIIEKIKTIAATDIPVLITGESGTGKELIAKLCHHYSNREGKFVSVNCSAIPDTLIESELFGAEKGSYTGANKLKIGLFELAHNGTIFLDEIGEMPYELQAKLLRVLQEGEIMRIGGNGLIKINSRVVAATNKNLEEQIKNNKFREDLYYRLNVVQFKVPPLRFRKDEIKPLSLMFLKEFNQKYSKNILGFSEDLITRMLDYPWYGNIRELKNKIEKAVVLCGKDWIDEMDVGITSKSVNKNKGEINKNVETIANESNTKQLNEKDVNNIYLDFNTLSKNLVEAKKQIAEQFEKKFILHYLNKNNWDVKETAEIIGLCRQDLYKKMKKVGIQKTVKYT